MKFEVGEIAIIQNAAGCLVNGQLVEIFRVGPFQAYELFTLPERTGIYQADVPFDYILKSEGGHYINVQEFHLRKRYPPEEAATKEFQADLKRMLKRTVGA